MDNHSVNVIKITEWIHMNVETWIGVTASEIAVLGAAAAGIKWLVKRYLKIGRAHV